MLQSATVVYFLLFWLMLSDSLSISRLCSPRICKFSQLNTNIFASNSPNKRISVSKVHYLEETAIEASSSSSPDVKKESLFGGIESFFWVGITGTVLYLLAMESSKYFFPIVLLAGWRSIRITSF